MINVLKACLYARVPVLLWSMPGAGKTATVRSLAAHMKRNLWTVIASYREPADFGGLPIIRKEPIKIAGKEFTAVEMAPPRFAIEAANDPEGSLLFLDEISCTPPSVQAPLLRFVHELVVGDLELPPDKVGIIAAANPPDMAAGGFDLSPPLANRFCHLDFKLDSTEWLENFPSYWQMPPKLKLWDSELNEEQWSQNRVIVSAFIRAKPGLLMSVPTETSKQGGAYPTCRSWDNVSRLMTIADVHGLSKDEKAALITGTIGPGAATEFLSWVEHLDLPNPEDILANPDKFKFPSRGDRQFAVLSSVINAVASKNTAERWRKGWQVVITVAKVHQAPDIAASAAKMLIIARPPRGCQIPQEADAVLRPMLKAADLPATR